MGNNRLNFIYYIFTHEKRFEEYNTDEEKLRELKTEYAGIADRLKALKEPGQLTEYEHRMVLDMSGKVLDYIALRESFKRPRF